MKLYKILVLTIILSIISFSCNQQKSKWQGTAEEVDGVMIVTNPIEPFYGELTFELEEDLRIGNEEDDKYLFYRARSIALDSDENIYVVDSGNYRIQKFDRQGKYLYTVGRKGEGPGEFSQPYGLYIDSQSFLYVREYRRLQVFNESGEFLKVIPLNVNLVDFAVDTEGNLFGNADLQPRDNAVRAIIKLNSQGEIVREVVKYFDLGIKIIVTANRAFTLSPNHTYTPRLCFTQMERDVFIFGYSSEYILNLFNKNGKIFLKIIKDELLQPISQKEKEIIIGKAIKSLARGNIKIPRKKVEEAIHFRKYRSCFEKIITDDSQRIYVQKVKSVFAEDNDYTFDVFNRDGLFLYQLSLSFSPELIQNGFLYDIFTSQDSGEVKIIRYKIKNWDQIKTSIN